VRRNHDVLAATPASLRGRRPGRRGRARRPRSHGGKARGVEGREGDGPEHVEEQGRGRAPTRRDGLRRDEGSRRSEDHRGQARSDHRHGVSEARLQRVPRAAAAPRVDGAGRRAAGHDVDPVDRKCSHFAPVLAPVLEGAECTEHGVGRCPIVTSAPRSRRAGRPRRATSRRSDRGAEPLHRARGGPRTLRSRGARARAARRRGRARSPRAAAGSPRGTPPPVVLLGCLHGTSKRTRRHGYGSQLPLGNDVS